MSVALAFGDDGSRIVGRTDQDEDAGKMGTALGHVRIARARSASSLSLLRASDFSSPHSGPRSRQGRRRGRRRISRNRLPGQGKPVARAAWRAFSGHSRQSAVGSRRPQPPPTLPAGRSLDSEQGQESLEFVNLLPIVGGEAQALHETSAVPARRSGAGCQLRQQRGPRGAFIWVRVRRLALRGTLDFPRPPAPVMTTFMSVSQAESSG